MKAHRLFIAIDLDSHIKDGLCRVQDQLREHVLCANFTLRDNLHLTLIFIGEVEWEKVQIIKEIMEGVSVEPFILKINGIGSFRRYGGDIWWAGIDRSKALMSIYHQLSINLRGKGFELENREYKPHLTLAREVVAEKEKSSLLINLIQNFDLFTEMSMTVNNITLFESLHFAGKLTYKPVYII